MKLAEEKIEGLEKYFAEREDIAFAYLFGSALSGRATTESDVDIAVYFTNSELELEADTDYPSEDEIWTDLERLVGRRVDLLVLNRAAATVAFKVLQTGQPLQIRDPAQRLKFYLAVSDLAESFRDFAADFAAIRARSHSLSETDGDQLNRITTFLEQELADRSLFELVDQLTYQRDRRTRRELERWAENIVNASIDVAKIILASEKQAVPETYRLLLENLAMVKNFDPAVANQLA